MPKAHYSLSAAQHATLIGERTPHLQSYNHTYNSRPYSPSRDVAETDSRLPQIHVYSHNLGLFRNDYDARNLSPIVPEWPALISIATQILLTQLQNQRISKVGATVQLVK